MAESYMAEWHDARGNAAEASALKATLRTSCAPDAATQRPAAPLPTGGAAPAGTLSN
jgi:hypothetical protein